MPVLDARVCLAILWTYCVEWYTDGMRAPGQTMNFLDDRWRWGTMENPDDTAAEDPSVPATASEKAAARGLL